MTSPLEAAGAARLLAARRTFPATERQCERCGKAFEGRGRARYCSASCRTLASRQRVARRKVAAS